MTAATEVAVEDHYAIAVARRKDATHWPQLDPMTWPSFVAWLGLDLPASRKECGGYVLGELQGGRRTAATVLSRSALTLDADYAVPSLPLDASLALDCALVAHTTWSHTPAAPRYRLVVPLSEPVSPDEYRAIARAVMAELGAEQFDVTTTQPERLMFRPSTQGHYEHHVFPGPPLDVAEWLAGNDQGEEDAAPAPSDAPLPSGPMHPYAARAIQAELQRLQACEDNGWDIHWNSTTYEVACQLIEFANSPWSGYTLAEAEENLLNCAPTDPDFGPREHLARWRSALNKVGSNSRPDPDGSPEADFGVDYTFDPDLVDSTDGPGPFQRTSLRALLDPNRPPREYVVEPLIAAGTSVAMIAPAGHKKSLLLLALAIAVARGDAEFAGMPIPRARRVFYLDMELTEDDHIERLQSFGVGPDDDLPRLVLVPLPSMEPLDTAKGGADLMRALDYYGLEPGDLVVLDSYQRVTEAGENDSDTTRAYYRHTGVRLKERGLTVIRTDNTGRDVSKGARGSSGKRDDVDVEYLIKAEGDYIELRTGKVRQRTVSELNFTLLTDEDGRTTFHSDLPSPKQSALSECVALLDDLGLPDAAGERRAIAALREADHQVVRNVVRAAVKARKERDPRHVFSDESAV